MGYFWFHSLQRSSASHEIMKSAFYKGFYQSSNNFLCDNSKIDFLQQGLVQKLDLCGRFFGWRGKTFKTSILIPIVRKIKNFCYYVLLSMFTLLILSKERSQYSKQCPNQTVFIFRGRFCWETFCFDPCVRLVSVRKLRKVLPFWFSLDNPTCISPPL